MGRSGRISCGSGQVRRRVWLARGRTRWAGDADSVSALDREVRYCGDPTVGGTDTTVLSGWPEVLTAS